MSAAVGRTTLLLFFLTFSVFVFSFFVTAVVRRYATSRALIDVPNPRGSHDVATPRGGGMAIVLGWALALAASPLLLAGPPHYGAVAALLGGGILVAVTGWLDDHGLLSLKLRLLGQFSAAMWAVAWLGGLPEIMVGRWTIPLAPIGAMLAVVGLVWLTSSCPKTRKPL